MPAIQLSRLKAQTSQLLEHFSYPENFLHDLHGLLDFYADRTRRPGTVSGTVVKLHQYHVPNPVMRSVEQMLIPSIIEHSALAITLADALWGEDWAECRLLAIFILGQLAPQPPKLILDRITLWGTSCKEAIITQALATRGTASLRQQAEKDFYQSLEIWITTDQHPLLKIGLQAIPTLIANENFENLPMLFRWLTPLIRDAEIELKDPLIEIMRAMALTAPQETTHFLRQILVSSANRQTAAIIRRALDAFPPDMRVNIQEIIRHPKY
jgi:hypothetical protein